MNLQERYIAAGVKHIPSAEKEEVEKAMRQLIAERLKERGNPSEEAEREVLRGLGNPRLLAERQLREPLYLVGPELYGTYMLAVKIVMTVAVAGTLIGHTVNFIVNQGSLLHYFAETLGSALSAAIGALGGVTLVFAIIERTAKQKIVQEIQDDWSLADIPVEEGLQKPFSRIGILVGLIFTLLVIILVNRYSHLIGFYYQTGDGLQVTPLLDPVVFSGYLPYINGILILQLLFTASKLIFRRWTYPVATVNLLFNGLIYLLLWFGLEDPNLINPTLLEKIAEVTGGTPTNGMATNAIKVVFLFILLLDSFDCFREAYKNSKLF